MEEQPCIIFAQCYGTPFRDECDEWGGVFFRIMYLSDEVSKAKIEKLLGR